MTEKSDTFGVLVFDMAHAGEPDGERIVPGFATLAEARAYAEARIRSSVEELRAGARSSAELRSLWHLYGEDCSVIGDTQSTTDIDLYIAVPATRVETDWAALTPRIRRYHAMATVMNQGGETAWVGGFLQRFVRPSRETLLRIFAADGREVLGKRGQQDDVPLALAIVHLFELLPVPVPQIGKTLSSWRVTVGFVCNDVKFGGTHSGVFAWTQEPRGDELDAMARVLMGDMLALRGSGPDNVDRCDRLSVEVESSQLPPDYDPWPDETGFPTAG